jgi:hypothetical protein
MQLKFYTTRALPYLMYDSETWSLRKAEERLLEAAEIPMLQCVANYTME